MTWNGWCICKTLERSRHDGYLTKATGQSITQQIIQNALKSLPWRLQLCLHYTPISIINSFIFHTAIMSILSWKTDFMFLCARRCNLSLEKEEWRNILEEVRWDLQSRQIHRQKSAVVWRISSLWEIWRPFCAFCYCPIFLRKTQIKIPHRQKGTASIVAPASVLTNESL